MAPRGANDNEKVCATGDWRAELNRRPDVCAPVHCGSSRVRINKTPGMERPAYIYKSLGKHLHRRRLSPPPGQTIRPRLIGLYALALYGRRYYSRDSAEERARLSLRALAEWIEQLDYARVSAAGHRDAPAEC